MKHLKLFESYESFEQQPFHLHPSSGRLYLSKEVGKYLIEKYNGKKRFSGNTINMNYHLTLSTRDISRIDFTVSLSERNVKVFEQGTFYFSVGGRSGDSVLFGGGRWDFGKMVSYQITDQIIGEIIPEWKNIKGGLKRLKKSEKFYDICPNARTIINDIEEKYEFEDLGLL